MYKSITFFADPGCPPCVKVAPIIRELIAEGLPIQVLLKSENPGLFERENVFGAPTLRFYDNGTVYANAMGELTKPVIMEIYNRDTSIPTDIQQLTQYERFYAEMEAQHGKR